MSQKRRDKPPNRDSTVGSADCYQVHQDSNGSREEPTHEVQEGCGRLQGFGVFTSGSATGTKTSLRVCVRVCVPHAQSARSLSFGRRSRMTSSISRPGKFWVIGAKKTQSCSRRESPIFMGPHEPFTAKQSGAGVHPLVRYLCQPPRAGRHPM